MTQETPIKKYPKTTSEVAQMLGIEPAGSGLPMASFPVGDLPVHDLPVVGNPQASNHEPAASPAHAAVDPHHPELKSIEEKAAEQPAFVKISKTVLPYIAVFIVGMVLYYFFFTNVDFSKILTLTSAPQATTPQMTEIQGLEQQDAAAYNKWIASYYYDVTDPRILDPNSDNSGNGFSNFQKYLLNLNPKSYDTLGLGQADSQTLAMGLNPLTGKPETDEQKAIVSKYIDMEVVLNRLTLNSLQNPSEVAGASTESNGSNNYNNNSGAQTNDGSTQAQTQNAQLASATNLNPVLNPITDSQVNIDTTKSGLLQIPDLKISVPIIWTQDPNDFEQDLQVGVVHYPGTVLPGQVGTSYIAGHSSNYVWAKGSYNKIFSTLGKLAVNTSFKITVTQTNGKPAVFDYVVTSSQQYSPTDQAQFANTNKSVVALSTCWPVGSTAKRLVVFGQLTQVEQ